MRINNDHEIAGNYSWAASAPDATGRGVFAARHTRTSFGYVNPSTNPFNQSEDRRGIFNRTVWGANLHATWTRPTRSRSTSVTDYLQLQKRYGEDSDMSPNFDLQLRRAVSLSPVLRGAAPEWRGGRLPLGRRLLLPALQQPRISAPPSGFIEFPSGLGRADFSLSTSSPSVFAPGRSTTLPPQLTSSRARATPTDDKNFDYNYFCEACPQNLHYVPRDFPSAAKNLQHRHRQGRAGLQARQATCCYAQLNRGAKGGGWSAPSSGPVDPGHPALRHGAAHELSRWASNPRSGTARARLNGSVFHYDYKNYQGFFLDVATQVVENIDAKVKGGELEFAVVPVHGLNMQLGVSHLESMPSTFPHRPATVRDLPRCRRRRIGASTPWPATNGRCSVAMASVESDAKWNSQQYLELINAPVDLQPSYAVINAARRVLDAWTIVGRSRAFVKNAGRQVVSHLQPGPFGLLGIESGRLRAPAWEYGQWSCAITSEDEIMTDFSSDHWRQGRRRPATTFNVLNPADERVVAACPEGNAAAGG